jgi:hypothetical protein
MRRARPLIGVAIGLAASAAVALAQTPAAPSAVPGNPLLDTDKSFRPSTQREISKRAHQPPEPYFPPRPDLSVPPPLTLDVPRIPMPDPRPPTLFNKDFPSLQFPREEEFGFTGRGD